MNFLSTFILLHIIFCVLEQNNAFANSANDRGNTHHQISTRSLCKDLLSSTSEFILITDGAIKVETTDALNTPALTKRPDSLLALLKALPRGHELLRLTPRITKVRWYGMPHGEHMSTVASRFTSFTENEVGVIVKTSGQVEIHVRSGGRDIEVDKGLAEILVTYLRSNRAHATVGSKLYSGKLDFYIKNLDISSNEGLAAFSQVLNYLFPSN